MTILETVAVYVGIPAAIYLFLAVVTQVPGRRRRPGRYRPGQAWDYPPEFWAGNTPVSVPKTGALSGTAKGGAHGTW